MFLPSNKQLLHMNCCLSVAVRSVTHFHEEPETLSVHQTPFVKKKKVYRILLQCHRCHSDLLRCFIASASSSKSKSGSQQSISVALIEFTCFRESRKEVFIKMRIKVMRKVRESLIIISDKNIHVQLVNCVMFTTLSFKIEEI